MCVYSGLRSNTGSWFIWWTRAGNSESEISVGWRMGNNCAFALVAGGGFHGRLHDSR